MLIKHFYAIHMCCCQNSGNIDHAVLLANQVRYVLRHYCSNITRTGFVDSFGSIAAILPERVIAAILPEANLHAKSSIARICCSNIAAIYCQKSCILVRGFKITSHLATKLKMNKRRKELFYSKVVPVSWILHLHDVKRKLWITWKMKEI